MHEGDDTCENTDHTGMRDPWARLKQIRHILEDNTKVVRNKRGEIAYFCAALDEYTLRTLKLLADVCPKDMEPAEPRHALVEFVEESIEFKATLEEHPPMYLPEIAYGKWADSLRKVSGYASQEEPKHCICGKPTRDGIICPDC